MTEVRKERELEMGADWSGCIQGCLLRRRPDGTRGRRHIALSNSALLPLLHNSVIDNGDEIFGAIKNCCFVFEPHMAFGSRKPDLHNYHLTGQPRTAHDLSPSPPS